MLKLDQKAATLQMLTAIDRKHPSFDAIMLSVEYCKAYEIHIDWHEFSQYLNELERKGFLILTGHNSSNMCQYKIDTNLRS